MSEKVELNPVMSTYGRFPITLVKGKGSYVWDKEGKKYLDYSSGIATCNLGHVPDVVEKAVQEQLGHLWHCSNLYHIPSQDKLAQLLVANSCGDQVFFCNSGAEANEAALKIAKKYAKDQFLKEIPQIVTFKNSFHGRTMATLSATGQEKIHQGFTPLTPGFSFLPFNDWDALEQLTSMNPDAVLIELVQGEGGVLPADKEWLKQLAKVCYDQQILLMVDEIQTGMGRTGTLFAYEQYEIEPDVISLAKGLGSGIPIGAIIAKEHVAKAFSPGTHGSTFGGNPIATTAGVATVTELTTTNVLNEANEMAHDIWTGLEKIAAKSNTIKQLRGMGLLIGLELDKPAIDYVNKAREDYQLLVIVAGPNVLRILPPLTTTREEVDQFLAIMKQLFI
ncbi:aspartate aminotransferase family protein [Gracilibacillus dipsosauri]|uniref:Acetylornithine aminotransferase n=1 Tax=Gracilibacillus dipsosauri TaxID=178340 RepID=A0A317L2G1_9BACI|nr:aspartate aminotransferase family protein [Gracilibacillus dipsosauri]PWU69676.1 aspartate aminotransferase family protein [Gracilibacillus dipsosauri]